MLISRRVRIGRIITGTGRYFLFDLFTCVLAYLANEYVIQRYLEFPALIPSILGTALAFFIGFNNNQAYDRWWEARKIWGALVNDSRTWARQIMHYARPSDELPESELGTLRREAILRHIAFLYALKENLRGANDREYRRYVSPEEVTAIEAQANVPNALLSLQSKVLDELYARRALDGFRFTELNRMIVKFCDEMGKSERIKNTVFPTTYNYYTRAFVWIFIVCVTLVTANLVGYWSVLFGTLVGYVFLVTHVIGQTLVDPFKPIPTSIPLNQITRTIEINLLQTMGEAEVPEPVESVNNEYVL